MKGWGEWGKLFKAEMKTEVKHGPRRDLKHFMELWYMRLKWREKQQPYGKGLSELLLHLSKRVPSLGQHTLKILLGTSII